VPAKVYHRSIFYIIPKTQNQVFEEFAHDERDIHPRDGGLWTWPVKPG